MNESQFKAALVERYLNNQVTNQELEVFLELLKRGELDDVMQVCMDREADAQEDIETDFSNVFKPWIQWLKVAASISLILW